MPALIIDEGQVAAAAWEIKIKVKPSWL
jgi:hypothetical protein